MSITSDMRAAWGPPCRGPWVTLNLNGTGRITVRAAAASAFRALNACLVKHRYNTRRVDTGAYNCRQITGGSNYSLHAYGIAADLNWQTNPYGPNLVTDMPPEMIKDIEALRTKSGHRVFRWGGRYSGNKDAMHFEVICTPAQLATGITSGQPIPPPTISHFDPTEVDMYIAVDGVGFFAQVGAVTIPLPDIDLAGFAKLVASDKSVGVMTIPKTAAQDFAAKTMRQTMNATT